MKHILQRILFAMMVVYAITISNSFISAITPNNHVDIGSSKELAYEYVAKYTDLDARYIVDRIWAEADAQGISDKTAVLAMFETETGFRQIPSGDGFGFGIGQLSYEYWESYDLSSENDIYDLTMNIHGSVYYYAYMLRAANGDPAIAYTGYNGGEGNMGNFNIPAIVEHMNNFIANYNRLKSGDPGVGYKAGISSIINYFDMLKALERPLGLNFDYIYKLGTSIRTALENITKGCIKAMQSLVDVSLPLLGVLAVIDVTMFIWRGPAITGQLESSFWTGMMQRLVKYGFLALLISMWPTVINKVFIGTDQTLLTQFSSTTAGAMSDITAPDLQLQHFLSFLNPSMTWLGELTVKGMFDHMGLFLLNMFITYTSMILFIILIFWLIVTYIEFYVSAIFSVFSLSFAGLKPTTFISEGMVSHLINSTIKLLCVGVVYAIMRHNMELFAYSATDALDILKAFTMVITAVVVGLLLPQRIAEGLSVQAKL